VLPARTILELSFDTTLSMEDQQFASIQQKFTSGWMPGEAAKMPNYPNFLVRRCLTFHETNLR
jgi:hypothetical protein